MKHRLKSKRPTSAFSAEHYEEFRSQDDVASFWYEVREVPGRTDGRTPKQYERYYLGIYLLALAEHDLLPYRLKVLECESPDFMLTWPSGEMTGLEVTRATDQTLQQWLSRTEREHPKGAAKMFSPLGYAFATLAHARNLSSPGSSKLEASGSGFSISSPLTS
jgi:hypothetical protein